MSQVVSLSHMLGAPQSSKTGAEKFRKSNRHERYQQKQSASRFTDSRRSVPRDKVKTSVGLRGGDCTFRKQQQADCSAVKRKI